MKLYDFEFNGKKYQQKSLKEAAKITGINYTTLTNRMNREELSIQDSIYFKKKQQLYDFEFGGKKYKQKSLKQVANITGINYVTLISRVNRSKLSIQEVIDKPVSSKLYDFEFNLKEYYQKNLNQVSEITGIKYITLRNRMRRMSLQEAIDFKVKQVELYDFEFEDKQYLQKNLYQISKITGIQYDTLSNRTKKMSIEKAISFKPKQIELYDFEFEGNRYEKKKLSEVANITDLPYDRLLSRIKKMSLQEAIDFKHKLYDFEFDTKQYHQKNLSEISKITGIKYITLTARVKRRGIQIQEAIDNDFVISKTGQYYELKRVEDEFNLSMKQVRKLKNLGFTYEDFKNM